MVFFAAPLQVALQILPGETFKTAICDIRSSPVVRVLFLKTCGTPRFAQHGTPIGQEISMPSLTEWKVPPANQPRPGDYSFDLDRVLASVVGLHSIIPADAFSADTLGTERAGNGVLIDDGLVLTIGYLITEAETVWLHLGDGRVVEGHALGFDSVSGFGLVQALGRVDLDPLPLGSSSAAEIGDRVVVGGAGGRTRSVACQIAARQEFAGYWEYLLDEAIFTYPAHPNWGGTGLISDRGELIGIGSLQLERERDGKAEHVNMIVPIDLLKPVLDDLKKFGRVNKPARPWLGMYSHEIDNRVVVIGISGKGPAARAELKAGDVILAVNGEKISSQTGFYRKLWALGPAGVDVPLTVYHDGVTFDVVLTSTDRTRLLKAPRLH
jgi:S1-C subfamily serine protease